MGDVLTGIHGLEQSLIYAIIGEPTQVSLFMATCQYQPSKVEASQSLPTLLSSTYPGIEIKEYGRQNLFSNLPYTALITGTPTLKLKSNQSLEHQIDRIIRVLYGTRWVYIVIAQPFPTSELYNLSDSILNELRNVTDSEKSANAISINPTAEKYKQLLNRFYNKIQTGKSQGMWQSIGYLLAQDASTCDRVKAIAKFVFSGYSSVPDPIRVINLVNSQQKLISLGLPELSPPQAIGKIVEEAHRLLKNAPPVADLETANMAGKAVESFSNILAEIRTYGEGIIVAEQIPSKLAPDIIKNTNLKIVHRVMAQEDRELIGGSMCLEPEQIKWLGSCPVGEAAIFGDGDDSPIRVKVPYKKITQTASDRKIQETMLNFKNTHQQYFDLYPWSVPFKLSQTYQREAQRILDNPEFQLAFARYVLSSVIVSPNFIDEFPNLVQAIRKHSKHFNPDILTNVLIYAVDWLIESRGRQHGVEYKELPKLKRNLATILLQEVRSQNLSDNLQDFQTEYQQLFTCHTRPFVGCDRICVNGCLYRYHVALLIGDTSLCRRFTEEMGQSEERWTRLMRIGLAAARQTISLQQIPAEEIKKVALCFSIQASEAIPFY